MKKTLAAATAFLSATLPLAATAQTADDAWRFQAIVYGYFPDIGGKTSFPERGGSSVDVDISQILSNLKFTFMGTFEAGKGNWGFFTDIIYLNVGDSVSNSRNVSIGGHELPLGVTSNLNLDIKATLWTVSGEYRFVNQPGAVMYGLAGARLLDLKETLSYNLSADVGPIVGPGRSGNSEASLSYWDAVVGVKGRVAFGANHEWSVPYYADVGSGQSKLTWQVFGGLGYQFSSWGSVLAGWRYMDYQFKSGSAVESLNLNGPMVGVAFNW